MVLAKKIGVFSSDCKVKDVPLPQWGKMRVWTPGYCRKANMEIDFFLEVYSH